MSKRIGYCEWCSVPLMEDDRSCVRCGAPAVVSIDIEYENPYFVDGGIPPKLIGERGTEIFAPDSDGTVYVGGAFTDVFGGPVETYDRIAPFATWN